MSATSTTTTTAGNDFTQAETRRRLDRLTWIARVMDTAIQVPGTNIRFGADAVIGLVPGIGDAAGGVVGLFIVNEARKLGLPKRKILRMLGNIAADAAFGSVPLVGDVFDVYFKSHRKNVRMVLDHFDGVPAGGMKDVTPPRR